MRRSPGTGSAARLRSDGRYEARATIGRRKQRSFFAATAREAERKRDDFLRQMAGGVILAGERVTVERYLRDWLEVKRPPAVRPATCERYRGIVEKHLIPAIGSIPLAKLTPAAVERMCAAMPGSQRSRSHARAVLRAALNRAVRHGDLARNAAALAEPPKVPDVERRPMTPDEIAVLLDALRGHALEPLMLLALTTGLRQGELLGLTWRNVDLDAGVLHVRHTLDSRSKTLSDPKTQRSRRTVAIGADVLPLLRSLKVRQAEWRLKAGAQWIDSELIFTTRWGRPLDGTNVTHRFQRVLADAGLPRYPFHAIRHTAATLMAASGIRPEEARDQLGHASIRTTLGIYSHSMPDHKRRIADAMGDALRAMRE